LRILILNWRCPRNPKAGGAELVTHEVARRLVARGDQVEWFSSTFRGALAEEVIDGVRIVREGRQWTVHWKAFRRYHQTLRGRFDAVIDQVNTVPFFTPVWANIPRFMFLHQLAREVWWYESPLPLNLLGYLSEPWYLRLYRDTPVLTVSRSTELDLKRLGFSGPITVIPEGLDLINVPQVNKEPVPTFLYVGRLSPSKRVSHVVKAFAIFRRRSLGKLWIAGDGLPTYIRNLNALAKRLDVSRDIEFLGRVSDEAKYALMARAHAVVLASVREGWGLVVTEANACGTPAVAYDVPGLRDSVRHEETGILVRPCPEALADGMARICAGGNEYESLVTQARIWSSGFSYEATTDAFSRAIAGAAPAIRNVS
jgi:glycosyltransferase involved in cell wall biosynthesis